MPLIKIKPVKGLIKKNLKLIKNKQWYHQRFDGCPHFLLLISLAELLKEKRKGQGYATSHFGIFEQDKADWYIDLNDIKHIADWVIKNGLRTLHFSKKLMKKWQKSMNDFFVFCNELKKIKLHNLNKEELKNLYHDYIELNVQAVSSSSIIDGFALGTDELIQRELNQLLKRKGLEKMTPRYFSTLTAPIHHSFINEAEVALLKVAQTVSRTPKLISQFKKQPVKILQKIIRKNPALLSLFEKQEKNWFWSKNNYIHNNYIDVNKWITEVKAVYQSGINIKQRINQILNTPRKNLREKNKLLKKLHPPKKLRVLLEISEDFTHWQDERKKQTYWSTQWGSVLLEEIGKRFGFSLYELKYCLPNEVLSLFTNPLINKKDIQSRHKKCLWHQKGEKQYEVISKKAARGTFRKIFEKRTLKAVNDFRGLAACRGVARGPVKVVKSATETKKLKQGDILVAVMTRPDYIAGMKRAAAIVTNEGGVTCHAAIVSRELNIPCVIGTKIATEVLKDGDIVEVNGNHGVVTVIKRNK